MNILHKISFIVLIITLVSCNRKEKLIDTWISAPVDTVFTTWDISDSKIFSNLFSPDILIAKYKIQGNKIIIDSGAVSLDDFYITEDESLQFRLFRDRLSIKISAYDSLFRFNFERRPGLLVYDKLLPNKLLNIDLPYVDYSKTDDFTNFDWIFVGYPKDKFLSKYDKSTYLQLNDVLTNSGDEIVQEFISSDNNISTVVFCDKEVKMVSLDSLRGNLHNHKTIFATLNDGFEIGYIKTNPYYYCNCIPISNIPPPRPLYDECKHNLFHYKKTSKNHFRIDTVGNYYFQDTLINISDIPKIVDLISVNNDSDTIAFIQYSDLTSFEDYIKLYSSINSQDKSITIIDINENDLNYIDKASW